MREGTRVSHIVTESDWLSKFVSACLMLSRFNAHRACCCRKIEETTDAAIARPERFLQYTLSCLLITAALIASAAPAGKSIDFQREIRPLLSENCFQCHGPDPKTRMAGLRLDLHDEVLKPRTGGAAPIVPGKSAESLIYQRISATNAARRMP